MMKQKKLYKSNCQVVVKANLVQTISILTILHVKSNTNLSKRLSNRLNYNSLSITRNQKMKVSITKHFKSSSNPNKISKNSSSLKIKSNQIKSQQEIFITKALNHAMKISTSIFKLINHREYCSIKKQKALEEKVGLEGKMPKNSNK